VSEVDLRTADILGTCTQAEARALTDQIKTHIETAWTLIKRAYLEGAWYVLGYSSWDAYYAAEFTAPQLRIPRNERREIVASLADAGMSQRDIATATGLSQMTVSRSLSETNDSHNDHAARITREAPDATPTPPASNTPHAHRRAEEQRIIISNAVMFLRGFAHGLTKLAELDPAISAAEARAWKAELKPFQDEFKRFAGKLEKRASGDPPA
jgi:predicted XRE-type DNA-binding protein